MFDHQWDALPQYLRAEIGLLFVLRQKSIKTIHLNNMIKRFLVRIDWLVKNSSLTLKKQKNR